MSSIVCSAGAACADARELRATRSVETTSSSVVEEYSNDLLNVFLLLLCGRW